MWPYWYWNMCDMSPFLILLIASKDGRGKCGRIHRTCVTSYLSYYFKIASLQTKEHPYQQAVWKTKIITVKEQMIHTWSKYLKTFCSDARDEKFDIKYNSEVSQILKVKVQNSLKHMKFGKTPGKNNTTTEIIRA